MVKFFSKNRAKTDGLQTACKGCKKAEFSAYYENNREHHLAVVTKRRRERDEETRNFIWNYLSNHPCVGCGQDDPIVLEFDHVDPSTKKGSVSDLAFKRRVSRETLQEEIAKCVVRCTYCHRRKTAREQGWYKSLLDPSE